MKNLFSLTYEKQVILYEQYFIVYFMNIIIFIFIRYYLFYEQQFSFLLVT